MGTMGNGGNAVSDKALANTFSNMFSAFGDTRNEDDANRQRK
jgi:hypothetical protein